MTTGGRPKKSKPAKTDFTEDLARDRIEIAIMASELEIGAEEQWSKLIHDRVEKLYRGPVATLEDRSEKRRHFAFLLDRSVLPAMVRLWRNSEFMPVDLRETVDGTQQRYTRCSLGRKLQKMAKASGDDCFEDSWIKRSSRMVDALAAFGLVEVDESRVNFKPVAVTAELHALLEAYLYVRSFEWSAALRTEDDDGPPGDERKV